MKNMYRYFKLAAFTAVIGLSCVFMAEAVGRKMGYIDVPVGGLSFAGTAMTSTAAELNYLDITTLGTGAASKAIVLDASGDYTFPASATCVMPSGGDFTFQSGSTFDVAGTFEINNVAMTSTAAELNYNAIANRVTSPTRRVLLGEAVFTVADAASTIVYLGGPGQAAQVDKITFCMGTTLPIDAGGVDVQVYKTGATSLLSGGTKVSILDATVNAAECLGISLHATATNLDLTATDQLYLDITTDATVDTNGTEHKVMIWGTLD